MNYNRIFFTIGVLGIIGNSYLLGYDLFLSELLYLIELIILLIHRFIVFKKRKNHYYMLEYCYYANFLTAIFIGFDIIYDLSIKWFISLYGLVFGPLLYGIFITKDKLYFHSISHLTSVFIHILPVIICSDIRWNKYSNKSPTFSYIYNINIKYTIPIYTLWIIMYYIILFMIKRNKLYDKEYKTAFGDLLRKPNSFIHRFNIQNNRGMELIYILFHYIYFLITMTISSIIFNSWIINRIIPIILLIFSIWNSSKKYCLKN